MFLTQPATVIASDEVHPLVILLDGTVWGCGSNSDGALGIISHDRPLTPVKVSIADMAVNINCRSVGSWIIVKDGGVWVCCVSYLPVKLILPKEIGEVVSMACSDNHRVLICKDGSAWGYGQLGGVGTSYVDVMDAIKLV
jgi:alpha-tubulin suppressor-like RCC1 family protein